MKPDVKKCLNFSSSRSMREGKADLAIALFTLNMIGANALTAEKRRAGGV